MAIGDGLDAERRRILAAMATAGAEGVAAYKAGQAEVQGVQQQALSSAARTAALAGVNAEGQGQLNAIVSQPGNLAGGYLAAGQDRYARDTARQLTANDDYMQQAAAAVPAIKADADRQIGLMAERWRQQQAKEAEANAAKASEMTQGEIANYAEGQAEMQRQADMTSAEQRRVALLNERTTLDKMEADAAKAALPPKVSAGPTLLGAQPTRSLAPDPAAVKRLEEIRRRRAGIDAEVARLSGGPNPQATANAARSFGANTGLLRSLPRGIARREGAANARLLSSTPIESDVAPKHEYQRRAAVGIGVNPAIAAGMFQPPKPSDQLSALLAEEQLGNYQATGYKTEGEARSAARSADPVTTAIASKAGIMPEKVAVIRKSAAYRQIAEAAETALSMGDSIDDLKFILNGTFANKPETIRLVLAEYGPRFTSSGFIPAGS